MSTNFSLKRRCEFCDNEFLAKTTVTLFCSTRCNSKSYKARLKAIKIQKSYVETIGKDIDSKQPLLVKELLTIKDVMLILEFSKSAVYALINSGELRAHRLSPRKTRVVRRDLMSYVEEKSMMDAIAPKKVRTAETDKILTRDDCYSIQELITLFGKTRDSLYSYLKRADIQKVKMGKEVFFSKSEIDKLYKTFTASKMTAHDRERIAKIKQAERGVRVSDCYSMEECVEMFGAKRENLYGIFSRRKVPKIQDGQIVHYSKRAVERIYRSGEHWKPVDGFEDLYEISSMGKLWKVNEKLKMGD